MNQKILAFFFFISLFVCHAQNKKTLPNNEILLNNLLTNIEANPNNPLKIDKTLLTNIANVIPDNNLKNKILTYSTNLGIDENLSMRQIYWDLNLAFDKNKQLGALGQYQQVGSELNVLLNTPEQLIGKLKGAYNLNGIAFLNDPYFMNSLSNATGYKPMSPDLALGMNLAVSALASIQENKQFKEDYKKYADISNLMVYSEMDRNLSKALIDAAVLNIARSNVTPIYRYDFANGASLSVEKGILKFRNPSLSIEKDLIAIQPKNNGIYDSQNMSFPILIKVAQDESSFYLTTGKEKPVSSCNCLDKKGSYLLDASTGEPFKSGDMRYLINANSISSTIIKDKTINTYVMQGNDFIYKSKIEFLPKYNFKSEKMKLSNDLKFFIKDKRRNMGPTEFMQLDYTYEKDNGVVSMIWGCGKIIAFTLDVLQDPATYIGTIVHAENFDTKKSTNAGFVNTITGMAVNKAGDLFFIDKSGQAGTLNANTYTTNESMYQMMQSSPKVQVAKTYDFVPKENYIFKALGGYSVALPTFYLSPDENWITYIQENELYLINTKDLSNFKTFKLTSRPYEQFYSKENGEAILHISSFNEFEIPIIKKYSLTKLIQSKPIELVAPTTSIGNGNQPNQEKSLSQEIKDLKLLLDDGTITKEEFDKAKNKLLAK